jgi:hypothetical protein
MKGHEQNRPQTMCRLTTAGRKRYLEYLATLEQVIRDAAKEAKDEPQAKLIPGLRPSRA